MDYRIFIPRLDALMLIEDGDVLLFRGKYPWSWAIQRAGRGNHSHVGVAGVEDGTVMIAEFRGFHGGRVVTLASQLDKFPGRVDVFRPKSRVEAVYYDRGKVRSISMDTRPEAVYAEMRSMAGQAYGWVNLGMAALRRLPGLRVVAPVVTDDADVSKHPPYCSQAVSLAWMRTHQLRLEGVGTVVIDPVPRLPHWLTEPCDLSRSRLFDYLFTPEA